ncbi:MBL fold metallo-hydrolase [Benzoatithermus flavus]|uniref:MBL fold metallo-hydrolase n=1 Tax=Benzoatithermus flavus TaxID=3108223 RepID=A0ABU8XT27_9PROT
MADDTDSSAFDAPRSEARRRLLAGLAAALSSWPRRSGTAAASAAAAGSRPWHHLPDGTFRNPPGSPERGGTTGDWLRFFLRRLGPQPSRPTLPAGHVLSEAEALRELEAVRDHDSITWLGHASFLIRLGGRTILTDPFLGERASPFARFGPERFAGPGLSPERLPPIDVLLLSHNHYDHLDLCTLARLGTAGTTLIMPLRLGRYLDTKRFAKALELDWMQRVSVGGLMVTAVPAIHFSKRGLFDRNGSLWCGYHLESGDGRTLLFAGDTAYGPVFRQVAPSFRRPGLALVPIGAYEPRLLMQGSHCTPEEGVQLGRDWGAARLCGMHWGTIQLTDEPPFEPPQRFRAAAAAAGYEPEAVWTLAIGETRLL